MMDKAAFEHKLNELVKEIGSVPPAQRQKLVILAKRTRQCHEELKRSVDSLQESLDYLRVSIKYLLFDLEATRRENSYLRKMLEENS
ncbi:MAG: transcriptional regulator [Planctomycetota bacterium]